MRMFFYLCVTVLTVSEEFSDEDVFLLVLMSSNCFNFCNILFSSFLMYTCIFFFFIIITLFVSRL